MSCFTAYAELFFGPSLGPSKGGGTPKILKKHPTPFPKFRLKGMCLVYALPLPHPVSWTPLMFTPSS